MASIVKGWNRDHRTGRDVIVMGTATDPNTKSVYVVVETDQGLELHRPKDFEESSRFKRADDSIDVTPRFTPIRNPE